MPSRPEREKAASSVAEQEERVRGIALVCGHDSVVRSVVRDDLGALGTHAVGRRLAHLMAPSSHEKADRFLSEAVASGAAFDWELGVQVGATEQLLHFAAASAAEENTLMVVGAQTRSAVMRYYQELMRINNEQANALRESAKAHVLMTPPDRSADVYEELTRLNNELATTQRLLAKQNTELASVNQLKNQFLGMAAHDLRNPIGAIRAYSSLLLDPEVPLAAERQTQFLTGIKESCDFMLALIDDLLDLSAIEAGQLRLDARDVDLARVVRDNVELNRMLAQEKHIDIRLDFSPDLPHIVADPLKVEQILHNLLGHAVKFSEPGTTVRVRCETADGGIRLQVEDEGPGIPPDEIEGIFKPFRRGTRRGTAGERGSGLGLAIVKRAVEGHGGRVTVESAPNRGATFSVWLPRGGPRV